MIIKSLATGTRAHYPTGSAHVIASFLLTRSAQAQGGITQSACRVLPVRVSFPASACIVDDDGEFVEFLTEYLRSRGCQAAGFNSAEALLSSNQIPTFGFFIVDLMLPGMDGVDLISLIRARSSGGILVLSGRMGPDSYNSALAAGADMFVNKPVRFDQVYHSMASIMRRVEGVSPVRQVWRFSIGQEALLSPSGRGVKLSPLETAIFAQLLAHQDRPLGRAELAAATDIAPGPDNRNLDAAVFRLRRKIERETDAPSPIRTVHGIGYQLSELVEAASDVDTATL